jgi:hypothetical protein
MLTDQVDFFSFDLVTDILNKLKGFLLPRLPILGTFLWKRKMFLFPSKRRKRFR